MTNNAQDHDIATIRQQLLHTFTAETLPRFCQDRPTFRPILKHFAPKYNLHEMIDELIDYCELHLLFDHLLAELEGYDASHYAPAAPLLPPPFNLPPLHLDYSRLTLTHSGFETLNYPKTNRHRLVTSPPYSSVRLLKRGEINWAMR